VNKVECALSICLRGWSCEQQASLTQRSSGLSSFIPSFHLLHHGCPPSATTTTLVAIFARQPFVHFGFATYTINHHHQQRQRRTLVSVCYYSSFSERLPRSTRQSTTSSACIIIYSVLGATPSTFPLFRLSRTRVSTSSSTALLHVCWAQQNGFRLGAASNIHVFG